MNIYLCLFFSIVSGVSAIIYCEINHETSTFESIHITCGTIQSSSQQIYSANFTSNGTTWNDASRIELNCTSTDEFNFHDWPIKCFIKVNTTNLQSGFYDIKMIISAEVNDSQIVTLDSEDFQMYVPEKLDTPVCRVDNYNEACDINPEDMIDNLYISCVAAVPVAKVNCSMIDTSKSSKVTITRFEAKPLLKYKNGTYSASCEIPINAKMLNDGLNINITYSQVTDQENTSLVSYSSASFSFRCPKVLNFTVNANRDGVCVNIGQNVTFRCDSDGSPPRTKRLQFPNFSSKDFQDKDITLAVKNISDYGYYTCFDLLDRSVYVVEPEQITRIGAHTYYQLYYTGINNNTAFVLIEVTGCPEPTSITVLRKKDEDSKGSNTEVLTEGVLVTYIHVPQWSWPQFFQYKLSGKINVTFVNKDLTVDLPEYSLNVSNGISYTILDFGVYNSDASLIIQSTAVCLLSVIILKSLF